MLFRSAHEWTDFPFTGWMYIPPLYRGSVFIFPLDSASDMRLFLLESLYLVTSGRLIQLIESIAHASAR